MAHEQTVEQMNILRAGFLTMYIRDLCVFKLLRVGVCKVNACKSVREGVQLTLSSILK